MTITSIFPKTFGIDSVSIATVAVASVVIVWSIR